MTAAILIIDDSEEDQHLYQRAFKDFDCELKLVSSAEAGFEHLSQSGSPNQPRQPDLILLDYNLPVLDGISFMRGLSKCMETPIPVIMLSGEGSTKVAVEAMKQGADDYLIKDTEGHYLRLLPSVAARALAAKAQRELARQMQQQTEILLRRNQTLMQNSMDGIHIMNMQGNIVEANEAFCRMLGYTPEEMSSLNVADWDAQWSTEELRERFKWLAGKSERFETVHRRKDGTLIDVEVSTTGMEIDGKFFLYAASRDITERKKAEASMLQHKLVIDTSIDGFWITDLQGYLLEANEAYAKLSGYTVEELTGMHISQLEAIELRPEIVQTHIARLIRQGYDRFETRHRRKDGQEIDIDISATYMAEQQQLVVFCRDIGERKRMQHAREALLRRHQTLMKTSMDGIHVVDMEGNVVEANLAFCRMLGYGMEEVMGLNVADWAAEFSRKELHQRFREHIGKSIMLETRHRRKDGTLIDVEISITGEIIDGRGLLFCSSRDITERKKAERELLLESANDRQRAEAMAQRFGSLLQGSINEIYLFDANTLHFIETSEGAKINLGYSAGELEQLTLLDLNPSFTQESLDLLAAPLRNGEQESLLFNTDFRRKDRTSYPVEVRLQFMQGDSPVLLAIVQDITERKRADASLRRSAAEIEDLYNNAPCGYHSLDKDGIIRQVNDTELGWLGYEREEVVGQMKLTDLLTPAGARTFIETFPQLICTGSIQDVELEVMRRNGTILVGLINATAIYDRDGNFVMTRSTVVDITERKHAEQQTRKLAAHLSIVREEEKASLAREIHDGLGGTLAALKMDTHWLKGMLARHGQTQELQERTEAMHDLLDHAVADMRRIATELRPTLLDDLGLMEALKWQAAQFRKRTGIDCVVACAEDNCDDELLDGITSINLFRIFQEALTNVARHSGASRVEAELHLGMKDISLAISDNGRGMPEKHRISPTSFGLRGMHERVTQLQGSIRLDTPPGGGLRVKVTLPQSAIQV